MYNNYYINAIDFLNFFYWCNVVIIKFNTIFISWKYLKTFKYAEVL